MGQSERSALANANRKLVASFLKGSAIAMAYDHSRKAGNLGDIWKHAVLVSIAERIKAQNDFRYVESHSGAPIHNLTDGGEWRRGIGAIVDKVDQSSHPYLRT